MAETNFVNLYTREFVSLAGRDPAGPGLEETLARKVSDAQAHAAIMDAKKGGSHLEAIAASLEAQAARSVAGAYKSPSPEEWEARSAFLRRSASMLRGEAHVSAPVSGKARLGLRLPG